MDEIGVGVLGLGTVGGGVVDLLRRHADLIAARVGVRPVLRRIAELNPDAGRDLDFDRSLLRRDAAGVVADPAVHIVVELIGGTGAARELTLAALRAGKPVVTANKALLAKHGAEVFRTAREHGTTVFFEASVGGGIPVIRALRQGLIADRIDGVTGILNGTCNYILTRMETDRAPFDAVLAAAQEAGYAEANPALDIDGHDTAHKAVILASLACGAPVPLDAVAVRGIRGLDPRDIAIGLDLDRRIKLLALIRRTPGGFEVGVEPCLVPRHGMMGSVNDVFNAILVRGEPVGDTLYYGRGAGRYPTASAILSDVADAALQLASGLRPGADGFSGGEALPILAPEAVESRHYLRIPFATAQGAESAADAAQQILARHSIHAQSVLPMSHGAEPGSSLVILTRLAPARKIDAAAAELGCGAGVPEKPVRFRMEDV